MPPGTRTRTHRARAKRAGQTREWQGTEELKQDRKIKTRRKKVRIIKELYVCGYTHVYRQREREKGREREREGE